MKKDKKGVLGMNTAQQFIVGILTLVILSVMALVIFAALRTSIPSETQTISFTNLSSVKVMNYTTELTLGTWITGGDGFVDCSLTLTEVTNRTGTKSTLISTNYTIDGCTITIPVGLNASHNNSIWNLTGSYSHDVGSKRAAVGIIDNTSSGLSQLFGNAITWFVLLGLVIIILIIGVVIGVVRGFGAGVENSAGGSSRVAQL